MKLLRVPLLLFALPAVVLAFAPAWHDALLLDRAAVGDGAFWRCWTGHWIHFSTAHAGWNLAVLLVAGAWLERLRPGLLIRHALLATPLVGLMILAAEPGLQAYGGLSGLATGIVVLLGLHQLRTVGSTRWLWAGVLALVALKTTHETLHVNAVFVRYDAPDVRTSSAAHLAGAVVALLHHMAGPRMPGRLSDTTATAG